jgi:hypothetical protein
MPLATRTNMKEATASVASSYRGRMGADIQQGRSARTILPLYKSLRKTTVIKAMTSKFNAPEEQGSSSEKQIPEQKLRGITTKSSPTTKGTFQIVRVPARRGHGVIVPGARGMRSPQQSSVYKDSVEKILDVRANQTRDLAAKVARAKDKLKKMSPQELEEVRRRFAPGASSNPPAST